MVLVMATEGKSINKRLYKITIGALKVIPMLLALCSAVGCLLDLFGLSGAVLSYIGGMSILPLLFLYLVSYVFKFCIYHRLFLHYITVTLILNTIDLYVGLPLSSRSLLAVHCSLIGGFLFLILYFYKQEKCCKR